MRSTISVFAGLGGLLALTLSGPAPTLAADTGHLLNVSYDPTREFYEAYNVAFAKYWQKETGRTVTVDQSHGGSGSQAQSVIDGLDADVVTLALQGDIDKIAGKGLISKSWRSALPNNSTPYSSTIVFLVRKGNPKGLHDFGDLIKDGVQVVTPNPKTSGGARWSYLAAWAWANKQFGGDQDRIKGYIKALYQHVPVLDTGARGSTITFAQKGIGDVLLSWENEAYLASAEFGADKFDIVVPPQSIKAEPPVAIVDKNVDAHGTRKLATDYLAYLYSPEGQTLAATFHYRPVDPEKVTDKALVAAFPKLSLVSIDDAEFGGWDKVQPTHFGNGGIFDQIYTPGKK